MAVTPAPAPSSSTPTPNSTPAPAGTPATPAPATPTGATFTVSNATELANALAAAKANGTDAATSRDLIRLTADIVGAGFTVDSPVILDGANASGTAKFALSKSDGAGQLVTVRSPDVEVRNLRFLFTAGSGIGVRVYNAERVVVRGCEITNGLYGIYAQGAAPRDYYVLDNKLTGVQCGIEFNRDVTLAPSVDAALTGGHFEVSGNTITGGGNGISWDGGNDGTTKNTDNTALRSQVDHKPSTFAATAVIRNNVLSDFNELGIAFSHIASVKVEANTVTMRDNDPSTFRNGIHIEKVTAKLTIGGATPAQGNTITTGLTTSTGIRVFKPSNPDFLTAPVPTDIVISNNRIIDRGGNQGIGGGGFVRLTLTNNRVNNGTITFTGAAAENRVTSTAGNTTASGAAIAVANVTVEP